MSSSGGRRPDGAQAERRSGKTAAERSTRAFFIDDRHFPAPPLEPALYIVSTPIGNLGDITLRALETLAAVDMIACEDTRVTATLTGRFGLKVPLLAYHEHNAARQRPRLLAALAEGKAIALVSDAGTPLVSDPGYRLVQDVLQVGHRVVPIPGASAPLAALVAAGLPSDTVLFAGFLPQKTGPRARRLAELATIPATLVFFESPHRLEAALAAMAGTLGPDRPAVIARELTKRFETFVRGDLAALAKRFAEEPVKGEIVVLVGPPGAEAEPSAEDADALLADALTRLKPAAAAKAVAQSTGLDRRILYQRALAIRSDRD